MAKYNDLIKTIDRLEVAAMRFGAATRSGADQGEPRNELLEARADLCKMLVGAFVVPAELRMAIEASYPALDARNCKLIKRRIQIALETFG